MGLLAKLSGADTGTFLLAILALGVLIIVHEGGHYFVARWSGMRVDRFSIGLGPKLFGFRRGETEFQVSMIPFGGYVQIAGMNPGEEPNKSVVEQDGKFLEVDNASDPRLYFNRPAWQRMATIFAGPATNYIFAALVMTLSFFIWGVPEAGKEPVVGGLIKGKPAETAGLLPGDEILSVDGRPVGDSKEVPKLITATQGRPFPIAVTRDGKPMSFSVTAAKDGEDYRIGVQLAEKEIRMHQGAGVTITRGLSFPIEYSRFIIHGFSEIFAGRQKAEFSGPLGILTVMKSQIARGWSHALDIAAIISVYLGFFNLLPIPALDGSRMVFIGYEMVARRKFSERIEMAIHGYGMLVLLGFILLISVTKDIPRMLGH